MDSSCWLPINALWRGISSLCFEWGDSSEIPLAMPSNQGRDTTHLGEGFHHLDLGESPGATRVVEWGTGMGRVVLHGGYLGGMFSRVSKGAFSRRRWKGVISSLWASGELACRPVPQAVRKERWSFPSTSMASISRHCMPSACDSQMEQACLALQDSAFLIVIEQPSPLQWWRHNWLLPPWYKWHAELLLY